MSNNVIAFPPCNAYDLGPMENWLSSMADHGLQVRGYNPIFGFFKFAKAESAQQKYRLVCAKDMFLGGTYYNQPTNGENDLYKNYGWQYICTVNGFYLYENDDVEAVELDTDLDLMADSLKGMLKYQLYDLLIFFVIPIPDFPFDWTSFDVKLIPIYILFAWIIFSDATIIRGISRLSKQLRSGIPVDHNASWSGIPRISGFKNLISLIMLVACIACSTVLIMV